MNCQSPRSHKQFLLLLGVEDCFFFGGSYLLIFSPTVGHTKQRRAENEWGWILEGMLLGVDAHAGAQSKQDKEAKSTASESKPWRPGGVGEAETKEP